MKTGRAAVVALLLTLPTLPAQSQRLFGSVFSGFTTFSAPQSLTVGTPSGYTIPMSWTAPATTTSTPALVNPQPWYKVEHALAGSGSWVTDTSNLQATSWTVTGVVGSTNYDVRVTACGGPIGAACGTPAYLFAVPTATTNVYAPIDGTYALVKDDEMAGGSVDTTRWNLPTNCGIGGGYTNDSITPTNASQQNGFTDLQTSIGSTCGRSYSVAWLTDINSYSPADGTCVYYEGRMKISDGGKGGVWPAFWQNNSGALPELDFFEWLASTPSVLYMTYHPANDQTLTSGSGIGVQYTKSGVTDWSAAWHVFGTQWCAKASITWFIDGQQAFQLLQGQQGPVEFNSPTTVTVDVSDTQMLPLINAQEGGFVSNPQSGTYPDNFYIDYVHIYCQNCGVPAVTPMVSYNGPGDNTGSASTPSIAPVERDLSVAQNSSTIATGGL